MSRRTLRNDRRRTAYRSIAWRHPYLTLFFTSRLVQAAAVLGAGYFALSWLWDTVPHMLLGYACGAVAVLAAVAAGLYRLWTDPQRGSRLPALSRPVLAWALGCVGVLLMFGAAYAAIGGTP